MEFKGTDNERVRIHMLDRIPDRFIHSIDQDKLLSVADVDFGKVGLKRGSIEMTGYNPTTRRLVTCDVILYSHHSLAFRSPGEESRRISRKAPAFHCVFGNSSSELSCSGGV